MILGGRRCWTERKLHSLQMPEEQPNGRMLDLPDSYPSTMLEMVSNVEESQHAEYAEKPSKESTTSLGTRL
jgi:hypothetical protein